MTMMYWYGNGMSSWGYALMIVSMVLFWGVVVLALCDLGVKWEPILLGGSG